VLLARGIFTTCVTPTVSRQAIDLRTGTGVKKKI
jgi:hypothetical protein